MRKFLVSIVTFFVVAVLVLVAVAVFLPQFIPVTAYKSVIEEQASNAIGRPVTLSDDLGIKIFPQTAFTVNQLTVANADGFSEAPFMSVEKAEFGLSLMKLISNRINAGSTDIEITKFVLTRPTISLEKKGTAPSIGTLCRRAPTMAGTPVKARRP